MAEILLTTLNARYAHSAMGLRCLMANLGSLQERARVLEFDINQRTSDVLEAILAQSPQIVGLGVYVWNVVPATQLAADLKRLRPEIVLVLGGPEVSHETAEQAVVQHADYVIAGEADLAFARLCEKLLAGDRPADKISTAPLPAMEELAMPYAFYSDEDLARRMVYVEASRGCPFRCEFCLSSLDVPVRQAPLEKFLAEMQRLLDRGLRQFKFVDRTFNLNARTGEAILQFFLDRYRPGLFLHFEMIPDRLPEGLRRIIRQFPAGSLQFEVGIQTFNETVAERIGRRQDNARAEENLRFLRSETSVHVHADLIVGLPGEDMESFGQGFDRLLALRPQEIQVGLLKRLRGAPIARHDADWGMVYSATAPYEVLQTAQIDFATMQRMRRFARYWDLLSNSGNFRETLPLLWEEGSPFRTFLGFCDWLYERAGRTHSIALQELAHWLLAHLTERGLPAEQVAERLWRDYQRAGRSDRPEFLRPYIGDGEASVHVPRRKAGPPRQSRHAP